MSDFLQKYVATVSYIGTGFCGWQRQKQTEEPPTIQKVIEDVLSIITQETVIVVASGRTDSGVHASGQVCHFSLKKDWAEGILVNALNSLLPPAVRVLEVKKTNIEFHAQKTATKKQYSYYFQSGPCSLPLFQPLSLWIKRDLNVKAMTEASQCLIGVHDFKAFQASGSKPGPTVREIFEAEICREELAFPGVFSKDFYFLRFRIVGSGFLKQMVRSIVGTLLQVGEGQREPSCIDELLTSQNRSLVGPTAPSRGLWLERVWYS